jgi:hypothetical protein
MSQGVYVIEGTEYERGWGQRPDGYLAFKTKQEATEYIDWYDKTYNNEPTAPDEYTKYQLVGFHECSDRFYAALTEKKFFNRLNELLT